MKPENGPKNISVDCRSCRARIDGLCHGCAPEVLREITGYKSGDYEFKAGQDILRLGEPCDMIYNLVEGWAFLYSILEDGRRQILHFALPGAVLCFHPASDAMAKYGVQALTDAAVCVLPDKALGPLSRQHPEIGMRLAGLIAHHRSLAYDHLTSVGRQSARERVAHLILELFIRCRSRRPGYRIEEMPLPLTQEHIGDATGLTAMHVNRVLRGLREDGIFELHTKRLKILDSDKLLDVAGVDLQFAMSWISP